MQIESSDQLEESEKRLRQLADKDLNYARSEEEAFGAVGQQNNNASTREVETFVRQERKVGRNEPCPCGSGKKFKVCHGRKA